MIALSIRQPWAWLIVNGHKTIENRSWSTQVRGRFLVHAGQTMTRREYADVVEFLREAPGLDYLLDMLPKHEQLERGGIVGEADLVGCTTADRSPWFMGEVGLILDNARPLPFTPVKGQLGFFAVSWPPAPAPSPSNLFS